MTAWANQLRELAELLESGVLEQGEFEHLKRLILPSTPLDTDTFPCHPHKVTECTQCEGRFRWDWVCQEHGVAACPTCAGSDEAKLKRHPTEQSTSTISKVNSLSESVSNDASITFDLEGWERGQREELSTQLRSGGIAHKVDADNVVRVPTEHAEEAALAIGSVRRNLDIPPPRPSSQRETRIYFSAWTCTPHGKKNCQTCVRQLRERRGGVCRG